MQRQDRFDFIIVGGGLQGCLAVQAITHHQPNASVLLIERNPNLCGNHTWSFLETDIRDNTWHWFEELVDKIWTRHHVKLDGKKRIIQIGYGSIFSANLSAKTRNSIDSNAKTTRICDHAVQVGAHEVTLESGEKISGIAVLDCRGINTEKSQFTRCGYQKFVGVEVELGKDWVSDNPCLMDDNIDQSDGHRFIYSLPFTRRRILLEDTRFSNSASLDKQDCLLAIDSYLCKRGFANYQVVRQESGCLPMPWTKFTNIDEQAIGYRGGFFHAATGYSLPLAANLAQKIAEQPASSAFQIIQVFRQQHRLQASFSRFLNRMLFRLIAPEKRSGIFHRFYKIMPDDAIGRFYGHHFTIRDAARIILGRLPSGLTPIHFFNSFREKPCPAH